MFTEITERDDIYLPFESETENKSYAPQEKDDSSEKKTIEKSEDNNCNQK